MQIQSRVFNSEIIIDEQNRWFYRGNEIIHPAVLEFFRENLSEDEKGIFIQNSYGAFLERGYVECRGFPLFFFRVFEEDSTLKFAGNDKKTFLIQNLKLYYDLQERLFATPIEKKFLKYGFSKSALNQLSQWLHVREDGEYEILYGKDSYPIKKYDVQFEVTIPLIL